MRGKLSLRQDMVYKRLVLIFSELWDRYFHCVKSVQIRSYSWSVFSCIRTAYGGLPLNLRIQSKYRKIWTRNSSVFGGFSSSVHVAKNKISSCWIIFNHVVYFYTMTWYRGVFRTLSNIYGGVLFAKTVNAFLFFKYFCKNVSWQKFCLVLNAHLC